jgi:outer membrane receptor for ferrienterochelin and colicins
MRVDNEKETKGPCTPPPPRRHSGRFSRQEPGRSSRAMARRDPRRGARLWLPCLAVALLPVPAWSQQSPPAARRDVSEMSLEELMEVELVFAASRHEESPREAPFPIFLVSRDEIRQHGCRTLAEVLERVPGFYVTNDRNYQYVGVRGFGRMGDFNAHVLVLVDGTRINENVYDYVGVGGDFVVDMDLVDRVEVVVGPSASLYGNSAFFAVVNVVTRRGRDFSGGELTAGGGSFRSAGGRATYGRRLDNGLEFLASADLFDDPGPRLYFPEFDRPETNHGVTEGTNDERSHRFFTHLTWRGLSLQAVRSSREKGIPTGAYGTVFGEPRNRTWDEATQVTLSGDHRLGARGSATISVNYGRVGYDGDYLSAATPSVVNRDEARGEWWRLEGSARFAASTRHTLSLGGDFQDNVRQDQLNVDIQPAAVYLDSRMAGERWAVYAQDHVQLPGQLTLDAGLRYDRYPTFGGTTSPRLGLVWQRDGTLTVKALYGRAFRAPNEYELHYTVEDPQIAQRGNPDLRPETIDTAELVLEHDLSRYLVFVASAFHSDVQRLIGVALNHDQRFMAFRNAGRILLTGLEVGLQFRRGGTSGRASYAFQHTRGDGSDERLVNSPSHLARASLSFPLGNRLSAGVDAGYMSSRRTLAGRETGGVFLANATLLARRLPGRFEASASVHNLFDRRYADPGGEEHVQDLLFQDGRTFRVELVWRF